jgi:hypothetical protein
MILSHITTICLVYTAEVGTNLCVTWQIIMHRMEPTHIYYVFQSPPQKIRLETCTVKKKTCNTPKQEQCSKQEPQSAPVSKNAAVSSSHQNVYQHKVK